MVNVEESILKKRESLMEKGRKEEEKKVTSFMHQPDWTVMLEFQWNVILCIFLKMSLIGINQQTLSEANWPL